jgi:hypothetical protein
MFQNSMTSMNKTDQISSKADFKSGSLEFVGQRSKKINPLGIVDKF